MLSMTDYLIQEQTTEPEEYADESVVLEAFAAMQASYSYLEYMDRLLAINEFCISTDIECPSIIQEGDFGDAVLSFFQNIWDWICGLVRSMVGYFNTISLSRIIKALKKTDKSELVIKQHDEFFAIAFGMKMSLVLIDDFAEVLNLINKKRLDDSRDEIIKLLQQIIDGDIPSIKKAKEHSKSGKTMTLKGCPYDLEIPKEFFGPETEKDPSEDKKEVTSTFPVDNLINLISYINELNIPKTGKKILKKLEYEKDDVKKNGSIDKEVQRLIRRAANNIAKLYDKSFGMFCSSLRDVIVENEIKLDEQDKAFLERTGKSKRTGRDQSRPLGGGNTKFIRAIAKS